MQTSFQHTNNLFVSCLLCLALILLSGCGNSGSEGLTAEQRERADWYIEMYGNGAISSMITLGGEDHELALKYVKYAVSKGADVNRAEESPTSWTPLLTAVYDKNTKVVEFLVSQGANVNAAGSIAGLPPLYYAAGKAGNAEIVKILISNGANVNVMCRNGGATPLHEAASSGDIEIVKLLVSNGANVNAKDFEGYAPHVWAKENREIIEYLSGR